MQHRTISLQLRQFVVHLHRLGEVGCIEVAFLEDELVALGVRVHDDLS